MRTIEDTFKIENFLQPKMYNRFKLGTTDELKEMFVKAFKHYDRTIDVYEHLDSYDEIIGSRKATDMTHELLLKSCDVGLSTVILKKKLITNKKKFANIKTKEDYVLWLKITLNNLQY